VSEEEAMYPSSSAGMRAFLEIFFSRHYFQVQNSLLDYFESDDFSNILDEGEIRLLDIGCGPAVGVLAVTDIIMCILEHLNRRSVRFVYVLNDTSQICLATGQRILDEYFDLCRTQKLNSGDNKILTITNDFPDNVKHLARIKRNYGPYHLAMFSYVIRPLTDENGTANAANDIVRTKKLCNPHGRILILQDQYRETLMRSLGRQINVSVEKEELTQEVFPNRGTEDTHTYSYYKCLYKPRLNESNNHSISSEAVANRA
jgi:hypothetical protein